MSGSALIRVAWLGFTTYTTAGTAKLRGSHIRRRPLWAGLWVGKSPQTPNNPTFISQNLSANDQAAASAPTGCSSSEENKLGFSVFREASRGKHPISNRLT